jgi:hypothetical protein
MSADPTTAHSDDRSRHWPTPTASAQPNGECGRVVRTSRRRTSLPPIYATRYRARGWLLHRMRSLASSISLLCVIDEGAGS